MSDTGHENDAGPLFRVGTRVRVIDYRRIHKGLIGVVREVKVGPVFIVDMEIKGNGSGVFNAAELERVS